MATLAEQVVAVFRQCDSRGEGTITRTELLAVLQSLGNETWEGDHVDQLLQATGAEKDTDISYEQFVRWIMRAPNGDGPLPPSDPVCQAAFEGSLPALKELLSSKGRDELSRSIGYIQVRGEVVGMWTMVSNTFELKALSQDPNILPANPLQWAAFGGRADIARFLMEECGMRKDDKCGFGWRPCRIAISHRIGLEGEVIHGDEAELQALLEDDDAPLCPNSLQQALAKRTGA